MNKTYGYFLMIFVCLASISTFATAQAMPTAEEIVQKAYKIAYYQGYDGKAFVSMYIKGRLGNTRERRFIILRRNEAQGEQKYYVYFRRPADVRRMVYMVWKHATRDDDRWLYLPALDLVKRIAASDRRSSFVGSHFVYEDVSGRNLNLDKHRLIKTTKRYFVLDHTPKDPSLVKFSHYVMWVDRRTYMPIKAVYYDKQNRKYRSVQARKMKIISGHPTVTYSVAKDLVTGEETQMFFKKVQYDTGIPANIFGEYYLRRSPRKWLR